LYRGSTLVDQGNGGAHNGGTARVYDAARYLAITGKLGQ